VCSRSKGSHDPSVFDTAGALTMMRDFDMLRDDCKEMISRIIDVVQYCKGPIHTDCVLKKAQARETILNLLSS
jgi:hypothetical protein